MEKDKVLSVKNIHGNLKIETPKGDLIDIPEDIKDLIEDSFRQFNITHDPQDLMAPFDKASALHPELLIVKKKEKPPVRKPTSGDYLNFTKFIDEDNKNEPGSVAQNALDGVEYSKRKFIDQLDKMGEEAFVSFCNEILKLQMTATSLSHYYTPKIAPDLLPPKIQDKLLTIEYKTTELDKSQLQEFESEVYFDPAAIVLASMKQQDDFSRKKFIEKIGLLTHEQFTEFCNHIRVLEEFFARTSDMTFIESGEGIPEKYFKKNFKKVQYPFIRQALN